MEQPTKLIKQANLELKRQSGSTARLRASSPIVEQNAPLIEFASPGSEISTVPHPSSLEHPSTLLTNNSRGFSSISSPNFTNPSSSTTDQSTSRSLRILGKSSSATETTPLGTIPEQSYGELPFPPDQQQQQVRADVHSASRPPGHQHALGQQPHGLAHGQPPHHPQLQHQQAAFQIPIFANKPRGLLTHPDSSHDS